MTFTSLRIPFSSITHAICAVMICASLCGCENAPANKPETAKPEAKTQVSETPAAPEVTLEKVGVLLNWFPEAEHGGFYAALVHGYYKEAGLDVEILSGGPNVPVIQQVARQQVLFGISNADGILFGRAEDAPIVAVMAPLQISPRCIMVHAKSGIKSFADLKDITIAMSAGSAFSKYLQKKFPLDGVKIVPYPGNVAQFLLNENYAQQGYVFSEPYVAKNKGGDPKVLMVSDVGFNPYTSCLIANASTIRTQPELVRKMTQASVKGWARYLEDPVETNALIHKLNPEMDLEVLAFGAKAIEPLVLDSASKTAGIGRMTSERWSGLQQQLEETSQLDANAVKSDEAFTIQFLEAGK